MSCRCLCARPLTLPALPLSLLSSLPLTLFLQVPPALLQRLVPPAANHVPKVLPLQGDRPAAPFYPRAFTFAPPPPLYLRKGHAVERVSMNDCSCSKHVISLSTNLPVFDSTACIACPLLRILTRWFRCFCCQARRHTSSEMRWCTSLRRRAEMDADEPSDGLDVIERIEWRRARQDPCKRTLDRLPYSCRHRRGHWHIRA